MVVLILVGILFNARVAVKRKDRSPTMRSRVRCDQALLYGGPLVPAPTFFLIWFLQLFDFCNFIFYNKKLQKPNQVSATFYFKIKVAETKNKKVQKKVGGTNGPPYL